MEKLFFSETNLPLDSCPCLFYDNEGIFNRTTEKPAIIFTVN
jgi:hypothetical protein